MLKNFIRGILTDIDGDFSSKRTVTFIAIILVSIGYISNLFFDLDVEQFMFESMMYIVLGGLGITGAEKFARDKTMNNQSDEVKRLSDEINYMRWANINSRDVAQMSVLIDKFDSAIEKLTEVSSTVSQLLAVQGNRLEFQEKVAEKIQKLVDKHQTDTDIKVLELKKDLYSDMEDNNSKLLEEIKGLRTDSKERHDKLNARISKIEKWLLLTMGGAAVVSYLLSKLDITKLFM